MRFWVLWSWVKSNWEYPMCPEIRHLRLPNETLQLEYGEYIVICTMCCCMDGFVFVICTICAPKYHHCNKWSRIKLMQISSESLISNWQSHLYFTSFQETISFNLISGFMIKSILYREIWYIDYIKKMKLLIWDILKRRMKLSIWDVVLNEFVLWPNLILFVANQI